MGLALINSLEAKADWNWLGDDDVLDQIGALSGGLVYVMDMVHGVVSYRRHPLLARLGLKPGQSPMVDALRPVPLEHRYAVDDLIQRHRGAADGELVEGVVRARTVDGEDVWIDIRAQVISRTPLGEAQYVLGIANDETVRFRHAAELIAAADALAHAELNERRRIGRELHDSTAQLLLAARLGLNTLAAQDKLSGSSERILSEAREAIDCAQQELRNFAFVLHPPELSEGGLADAVRTFTAGFARRTGLAIDLDLPTGRLPLSFSAKFALFRIAQEALMNVYRHAQAARVSVRLTRKGRRVVLEVEDDGVGLKGLAGAIPEGVGVNGMRARIAQLGGAFEFLPTSRGVLVRASVMAERTRRAPRAAQAAPLA